MVSNCNEFDFVNKGEGCQDVLDRNDVSLSQFYEWNPAVGNTCAGLWADVYVCVGGGRRRVRADTYYSCYLNAAWERSSYAHSYSGRYGGQLR
ncbi:LysM peptidoglycan-binding domain-containing protein [Candidatus Bathyarchaeota archaeon]|nr:LysM peptidoglycan-binding domain-containing protein [Candidatus Bathyarchaeota archaeon]